MKDLVNQIIYVAMALVFILGMTAFFVTPAYEKGVWAAMGLFVVVVTNVLSFKFGVHQIGSLTTSTTRAIGETSLTEVKTEVPPSK